ncbi:hypothetical protein ABPG72_006940 [Tetrahymena utriculariae]
MSQFKPRNEVNKTIDSWTDNYDELLNEKSSHTNQLKTFTPVNTLIKKQEFTNMQPNPSSFKKESYDQPLHANRLIINLASREGETTQLNLQGTPQTPNMIQSNQGIQRSTTMNQQNSQIQEQANAYLKDIELKNQNKYFQQREELDNLKYLSIVYNVNSIVNKDFLSYAKHNQIQKEIYNASIDGLKLQNRLLAQRNLGQTQINIQMIQKQTEKTQIERPYKNILTSLQFDKTPKQQLLVVEFVNMGQINNINQLEKNGVTNSGPAAIVNSIQNTNGLTYSQRTADASSFFLNFKAFPTLYHLNFETNRDPCPFIAIDRIQGRHFIYNNDDKIMVFSHEPISNPVNDKSKPLLLMSLDDKLDDILAQKANGGQPDIGDSQQNPLTSGLLGISGRARINPTLQIITDQKGNSALLVIGGYLDMGNGQFQPKTNIKVFNIGKRKIDIRPAFQIQMRNPRINPIVMRVKQSHCKDAKVSQTEDRKFLLLLGGANPEIVDNRKVYVDTNTCCSVIDYENIFKQLERKDTTQLEISQTLKVFYNDQEAGRNLEKVAQYLSRGVFIHQKSKKSLDMHNKMYILTEKKKQLLQVHSISLSENFVNIFDIQIDIKTENQWSYTNACIVDNYIMYITPQQFYPTVIDTSTKHSKQMNTEEIVEFNSKKQECFDSSNPKQSKTSCSCNIY